MNTTNFEKHTNTNPISRYFLNNFSNRLLDQLKELKINSLLDVGAGEGFMLHLIKKNKIAKQLEGIEYMDDAIALGKKTHPDIRIIKGDIYKLPYKTNAFDVIICTEVMEHLEYPEKALTELKRVSRKYVVLSVPNEPYFTIQRFLRGKNIFKLGDHPEHIQHWSQKKFTAFVGTQLKIKNVITPLPWTMVVAEK